MLIYPLNSVSNANTLGQDSAIYQGESVELFSNDEIKKAYDDIEKIFISNYRVVDSLLTRYATIAKVTSATSANIVQDSEHTVIKHGNINDKPDTIERSLFVSLGAIIVPANVLVSENPFYCSQESVGTVPASGLFDLLNAPYSNPIGISSPFNTLMPVRELGWTESNYYQANTSNNVLGLFISDNSLDYERAFNNQASLFFSSLKGFSTHSQIFSLNTGNPNGTTDIDVYFTGLPDNTAASICPQFEEEQFLKFRLLYNSVYLRNCLSVQCEGQIPNNIFMLSTPYTWEVKYSATNYSDLTSYNNSKSESIAIPANRIIRPTNSSLIENIGFSVGEMSNITFEDHAADVNIDTSVDFFHNTKNILYNASSGFRNLVLGDTEPAVGLATAGSIMQTSLEHYIPFISFPSFKNIDGTSTIEDISKEISAGEYYVILCAFLHAGTSSTITGIDTTSITPLPIYIGATITDQTALHNYPDSFNVDTVHTQRILAPNFIILPGPNSVKKLIISGNPETQSLTELPSNAAFPIKDNQKVYGGGYSSYTFTNPSGDAYTVYKYNNSRPVDITNFNEFTENLIFSQDSSTFTTALYPYGSLSATIYKYPYNFTEQAEFLFTRAWNGDYKTTTYQDNHYTYYSDQLGTSINFYNEDGVSVRNPEEVTISSLENVTDPDYEPFLRFTNTEPNFIRFKLWNDEKVVLDCLRLCNESGIAVQEAIEDTDDSTVFKFNDAVLNILRNLDIGTYYYNVYTTTLADISWNPEDTDQNTLRNFTIDRTLRIVDNLTTDKLELLSFKENTSTALASGVAPIVSWKGIDNETSFSAVIYDAASGIVGEIRNTLETTYNASGFISSGETPYWQDNPVSSEVYSIKLSAHRTINEYQETVSKEFYNVTIDKTSIAPGTISFISGNVEEENSKYSPVELYINGTKCINLTDYKAKNIPYLPVLAPGDIPSFYVSENEIITNSNLDDVSNISVKYIELFKNINTELVYNITDSDVTKIPTITNIIYSFEE